ncbi:unnamed protein product [Clonostachys solani]|uniref:Transcription factor domain-containing protein n=1 Tax=Clonostachys solani TaxID=160281 RepID=A0A9P0ER95_9HYPO|nr:unnamed protein product [Clonostachys solani]
MLVYPFTPILSPVEVHKAIDNMADSSEDTAFVYGFAAVTTFLVQEKSTPSKHVREKTEQLIQRSLEAHRSISFQIGLDGRIAEDPRATIKRILTCVFLEISMMAFERFDSSFFILREAISMIQIFQVRGLPSTGPVLAQYQRLYWEAYIHERFLTFNSGFPNVLPPLSTGFPESDTSVPRHIELGFNRIISLFMLLDEDFLRFWRSQAEPQGESDLTADWIEYKQSQLDEDEMSTFEEDERLRKQDLQGLNEFQHADIYITRLWIRTLVWQLALSRGLLRSLPPQDDHAGLSLQYPARQISAQLRNLVGRVENLASITMQGSGIAHKLFDITSTIADVLTVCYTREYEREKCFQLTDLEFLVNFLSQFEQLRQNQMDYLREKLHDFGKGPAA